MGEGGAKGCNGSKVASMHNRVCNCCWGWPGVGFWGVGNVAIRVLVAPGPLCCGHVGPLHPGMVQRALVLGVMGLQQVGQVVARLGGGVLWHKCPCSLCRHCNPQPGWGVELWGSLPMTLGMVVGKDLVPSFGPFGACRSITTMPWWLVLHPTACNLHPAPP